VLGHKTVLLYLLCEQSAGIITAAICSLIVLDGFWLLGIVYVFDIEEIREFITRWLKKKFHT